MLATGDLRLTLSAIQYNFNHCVLLVCSLSAGHVYTASVSLYLVFATGPFLLLLYEIGGGSWRRSRPHAADDSDAVLREGREAQLLALPHLDALELLEAPESELRRGDSVFTPQHPLQRQGRRTASGTAAQGSPECSSTAAARPSSWGNGGRVRCRT